MKPKHRAHCRWPAIALGAIPGAGMLSAQAQAPFDWKRFKGEKIEIFLVKSPRGDLLTKFHKEFEDLTGITVGLAGWFAFSPRLETIAELDPEALIDLAAGGKRAVQIDRLRITSLAQESDEALAFAEPVDADHMRPLGELFQRFEQLRHLVHRHEPVARDLREHEIDVFPGHLVEDRCSHRRR